MFCAAVVFLRDLFSGALFRRVCAWNPGEKKPTGMYYFMPNGECTEQEYNAWLQWEQSRQQSISNAKVMAAYTKRPITQPFKPSLSDLVREMGEQFKRTEQELVFIRGERDYLRGYLHYADWNDAAKQAIDDALKARAELLSMTKERDAALVERNMWKANHDNQVKMKRSIEGANRALIDERTELHRTYGIELGEWKAVVAKIASAVPMTAENLNDAVRVGDEVSTFLALVAKRQTQAVRDQAYLHSLVTAGDGGVLLGRFDSSRVEQIILTLNAFAAGVH